MDIVTGLAAVEPDPAAPERDALLDTATALAQLLGFRRACFTATTGAEQAEATAKLTESAAGLITAYECRTAGHGARRSPSSMAKTLTTT